MGLKRSRHMHRKVLWLFLPINRNQIDLLFTDIGLYENRHGGIQLAQEAVKHRPNLKVLYTSGQGVTDGMKALFVENSAFIPKP